MCTKCRAPNIAFITEKENLYEEVYNTLKDDGASNFADAVDISAWAYEGVMKAASAGIMQGSEGLFRAQSNSQRCEAAQVFMNLVRSYIAQ